MTKSRNAGVPEASASKHVREGAQGKGSEVEACGCAAFRKPELAALAHLYWSPPGSDLVREDLIERARAALLKYRLEPEQLDDVAPLLASAMHMLIEQNGGRPLPEDYAREIEHHVLKWHGLDTIPCVAEEIAASHGCAPAKQSIPNKPASTSEITVKPIFPSTTRTTSRQQGGHPT